MKGWTRIHLKPQGWWNAWEECCILDSILTADATVLIELKFNGEKIKYSNLAATSWKVWKYILDLSLYFSQKVQQTLQDSGVLIDFSWCLTEVLSFSSFLHTPSINHSDRWCPAECNLTSLHLFTASCHVTIFIWFAVKAVITGIDLSDNEESPEKD